LRLRANLLFVVVIGMLAACQTAAPATAKVVVAPRPETLSLRSVARLDEHLRWRLTTCGADPHTVGPVDERARRFVVDRAVVDGCLVVTIDLLAAADALRQRDAAVRHGDDVVTASPDLWLWTTSPPRPTVLTIQVADGVDVAVPFPRRPDGAFDVDVSTWRWLSSATFGRIHQRFVEVQGGAHLRVVTLPGTLQMSADDVDRWLQTAARAVALGSAGRRFPIPEALIVVDPVGGDDVPFGMVTRGGGPQVLLLLGGEARVDDVVDSWVAVHELSHLLSPPVGLDEAWFGEGLASYHQNVLRARAGLLTSTQAWGALLDGFERGRASAGTMPLREASAVMRSEGRWLQVYWGGAALVLAMDVALRRCGSSIDEVVAGFRAEQPRADTRRLAASAVVARAAQVPACAGITAMVEAGLARPFPEVSQLLADLGVDGAGAPTAPMSPLLRDAIMGAGARPGR